MLYKQKLKTNIPV